jgi:hypothetical protein
MFNAQCPMPNAQCSMLNAHFSPCWVSLVNFHIFSRKNLIDKLSIVKEGANCPASKNLIKTLDMNDIIWEYLCLKTIPNNNRPISLGFAYVMWGPLYIMPQKASESSNQESKFKSEGFSLFSEDWSIQVKMWDANLPMKELVQENNHEMCQILHQHQYQT